MWHVGGLASCLGGIGALIDILQHSASHDEIGFFRPCEPKLAFYVCAISVLLAMVVNSSRRAENLNDGLRTLNDELELNQKEEGGASRALRS